MLLSHTLKVFPSSFHYQSPKSNRKETLAESLQGDGKNTCFLNFILTCVFLLPSTHNPPAEVSL